MLKGWLSKLEPVRTATSRGELAFFLPGHRRAASVTSVTDGRVLVLQSKTLRELIDSDPRTGALVLLRVGHTMAERLANASSEAEAG